MVAGKSVVDLQRLNLSQNFASCSTEYGDCTVNGGAIAITGENAFSASQIECSQNLIDCEENSNCRFGLGGCLYSGETAVIIVQISSFSNNSQTGIGGGGKTKYFPTGMFFYLLIP